MLGTPVAMASIGGAEVRMVVDTGAQFGYLRDRYLQGRRSLGPRDDFHPILGDYTTEVFEVPVTLGDATMNLVFGAMPPGVALMMDMANTDGVLGTDLFDRRRARIALPDWEMILSESSIGSREGAKPRKNSSLTRRTRRHEKWSLNNPKRVGCGFVNFVSSCEPFRVFW